MNNLKTQCACLLIIVLIFLPLASQAKGKKLTPEMKAFINKMVKEHNLNRKRITNAIKGAKKHKSILEAMDRPAEAKPWYEYRPLFLDKKRISGGVKFYKKNQRFLRQAQKKYGVPAEIITAIIGVESRYGRHKGGFRAVDALYTLGFYYPRRGEYFQQELGELFLLSKEERLKPLYIKGSYAGAMGWPQFMPSSYRNYAVDFNRDGIKDIINSRIDAIGSVANYLKSHGWQRNQPISYRANIDDEEEIEDILELGIKPTLSLAELKEKGISSTVKTKQDYKAALLELEGKNKKEYWLGYDNFYVITRYNRSIHYAMAVFHLSKEIKRHSRIKKRKKKST